MLEAQILVIQSSLSREDTVRNLQFQNAAARTIYILLSRFDQVSLMLTYCMVHKVLSLKEPQYLSERLRSREEVSEQCVSQREILNFPTVRLETSRKISTNLGLPFVMNFSKTLPVS
ncbi:hypothetical protein J6590_081536 [Homalodisca vitripennis]|nr:hypothetical protein J6590_081536 [Homalodisca vitripennis]